MKSGIELIAEERKRQIEVEGWKPEHDDVVNNCNQLADAAACYAMSEDARAIETFDDRVLNCVWPWQKEWWKPTPDNRIRELQKAGALIAAEIDRLQRADP